MDENESTGYYHVQTSQGRSAQRGKMEATGFKTIKVANEVAREIFKASIGVHDEPDIAENGTDTKMFFGTIITGLGSGLLSISVSETFPDEMKKPDLITELTDYNVENVHSLSLHEMRQKFAELKMPQWAAREKEAIKIMEEADLKAKEHKCKICGVPGGIKSLKEALLVFELPNDEKEYYHMACAKNNYIILSSTNAKKFLGPTLFAKKEHTNELPEAAGGESPFGNVRYFRISDMEAILRAAEKSVEDSHERIKDISKPKEKGPRKRDSSLVYTHLQAKEIMKKRKSEK
jgi:hypothetical protein